MIKKELIEMSNAFRALSESMAAAIQGAAAAVVRVEGRRRIPATGIIWSAKGLIVTASHVVRRREGVAVGLDDGRTLAAEVIGRDRSTDLALLRVEADELTPLEASRAEETAVGQLVLALGRPGQRVQATLGIVSAYGEGWRTRRGGRIDNYLQTDVLMYPGFSGGPLIDADGRLLGLNSSHLLPGISVTIPTPTLEGIVGTLTAHGRVRRGYLGVSTQRVRLPRDVQEQLGQKRGLLIVAVEPDSPAEQGGLLLGDTIVAFGEEPVRRHEDLLAQLNAGVVDEKAAVRILRGGEVVTVKVKIGERT
jgi:S1-C subfamily serine protease